jgi:hypothetical protein
LEDFGGCTHGVYRRGAGRLGGGARVLTQHPCRFPRFPQALALFSGGVERRTGPFTGLARFLCQPPELLRLEPGRLGCYDGVFGGSGRVLRWRRVFVRQRGSFLSLTL